MGSQKVMLALATLGAFAATGAFATDRSVSSDGSNYVYRGAPLAASAPSVGTDSVSRSAAEAAGASFDAPAESGPADGLATVAYGNPRAGRQGRSIVGWDSRMRAYTTAYPNRAIVYISRNAQHHCTGWMISPNTLVTAGHCVHRGGGGSANFYPVSSFRVFPGYDGVLPGPYGSCTVRRTHTVNGWSINGSAEFDYGAMRLNCTIGNTTGWFGYYVPTGLTGQPMIISGYPGDKPKTQWLSSDIIRTVIGNRAYYRADTVGGHSGSPVWNDRNAGLMTNGAWAFAIHAYGANSQQMNSAPWLRSEVVTNLNNWRNAPN